MQHRLPGVEMTEVEVHMATYSPDDRLPTGSTNLASTVTVLLARHLCSHVPFNETVTLLMLKALVSTHYDDGNI